VIRRHEKGVKVLNTLELYAITKSFQYAEWLLGDRSFDFKTDDSLNDSIFFDAFERLDVVNLNMNRYNHTCAINQGLIC
jgi:hypothetical protein